MRETEDVFGERVRDDGARAELTAELTDAALGRPDELESRAISFADGPFEESERRETVPCEVFSETGLSG